MPQGKAPLPLHAYIACLEQWFATRPDPYHHKLTPKARKPIPEIMDIRDWIQEEHRGWHVQVKRIKIALEAKLCWAGWNAQMLHELKKFDEPAGKSKKPRPHPSQRVRPVQPALPAWISAQGVAWKPDVDVPPAVANLVVKMFDGMERHRQWEEAGGEEYFGTPWTEYFNDPAYDLDIREEIDLAFGPDWHPDLDSDAHEYHGYDDDYDSNPPESPVRGPNALPTSNTRDITGQTEEDWDRLFGPDARRGYSDGDDVIDIADEDYDCTEEDEAADTFSDAQIRANLPPRVGSSRAGATGQDFHLFLKRPSCLPPAEHLSHRHSMTNDLDPLDDFDDQLEYEYAQPEHYHPHSARVEKIPTTLDLLDDW